MADKFYENVSNQMFGLGLELDQGLEILQRFADSLKAEKAKTIFDVVSNMRLVCCPVTGAIVVEPIY